MSEELKPFLVEIAYSGVVMAKDRKDARLKVDRYARQIVSDNGDPMVNEVHELKSIAHLRELGGDGWDADCCAYGGGTPRLGDLLPKGERDTLTGDLFGGGA